MIKKLLAAVLIWFFVSGNSVFAQKEHYVWYFGDSAGVDFNSGVPVTLTNSGMNAYEGCSSISDANGSILFYTDGLFVWDKNHTQMPNGFGLFGGVSSSQSALIVPFINNDTLYYIFTVEQYSPASNKFSYSVVDMSLNSGNGDVTIKNSLLYAPVSEKLTAVKHSNNTDIWVMVHGLGDNNFYAFLVTAGGISPAPVISTIGQITPFMDMGYMKFSPGGTKIAFAEISPNYVDLFDFNTFTGIVTSEKYLTLPNSSVYGLEFSPNSRYLYCGQEGFQDIYQWDISSNIASVINSTLTVIGTTASMETDAFQLGPDGKIYVAGYLMTALGVINYPDSGGLACNYVDNAISLSGKKSFLGLPNYVTSYFLPTGISNPQPLTSNFQIFPNPANDKITISFGETRTGNVSIKIYSITGKIVFEETNKSTAPITNYQIPIFNISNGIYFLSVQTDGEVMTKKIVVNH